MANARADKPYRLTALGRLAASTRDAMGDTLGSFSGMALEPGSWRAAKSGFTGVFVTLGDRGFNVPEKNEYRNYPTRVQRIAFALSGAKLTLTPIGTRFIRDENGALTTGLDPGWGSTEQFGVKLPSPEDGRGAGRLSLDSEGIAIRNDHSFFVSDELGPNVYACAEDGRMVGVITPPDAFVPTCDGKLCFSARNAEPDRGRMPNDGFEGLSLSPDGKKLFVLLQNPLAQDRRGKRISQRYTRLLVYDVSGKRLPRKPDAHYVVELPLHGETLDGPMTEAAEANEVVALSGGRVLILTRESFGFGAKERHDKRSVVHKRVMIGSLDGVSNIAGSRYERKAKSIMDGGKLEKGIDAVQLDTFIDIADEEELNRVGLTAKAGRKGFQLLSAKWELMVLSPPIDAKRPRERLLFIGNDNDFRTREGYMPDGAYDGEFDHDNFVLVYRVTLPG